MQAQVILQPGKRYGDLIRVACESGAYDHARAAFAYVTRSGVKAFDDVLSGVAGTSIPRKWEWLSSIDWCRSDPDALSALNGRANNSVKIHDGAAIVRRTRCTPRLPFHPKGLLLTGPNDAALVLGSGNLSGNGLQRGHEWGTVLVWNGASSMPNPTVTSVIAHFDRLWRPATKLDDIAAAYLSAYQQSATVRLPVPTDDDAVEDTRPHGIPISDLNSLRAANRFWIEFLPNRNRGRYLPGNQLMMSRNMRVFFGFPARDLPTDSMIGAIDLYSGGDKWPNETLRFSNNSMDVLNLPVPGSGSLPASYDNRLIEFIRKGHRRFEFRIHPNATAATIQKVKGTKGVVRTMRSGRPWGWE